MSKIKRRLSKSQGASTPADFKLSKVFHIPSAVVLIRCLELNKLKLLSLDMLLKEASKESGITKGARQFRAKVQLLLRGS
ncbi:hypothetical protein Tco_1107951 [Tanacetum coccineum]